MSDEIEDKKPKGGIVPMLVTAAAGGAAAFAFTWLDPLAGDEPAKDAAHEDVAEAAPAKAALLMLDPIVVSLTRPEGARRRAPKLRVVIALETDETVAEGLAADDARLRDGFTAAARGLGAEALAGPQGLETLRAAFLAAARGVLGEDAVHRVLVTDYVMT